MIHAEKYKAEHLMQMTLQPSQKWLAQVVDIEKARALEVLDLTTVFDDDHILFIGGIMPIWPGRGFAVTFIDDEARKHWKAVHRATKRYLDAFAPRRTEAAVAYGPHFERECRWLERLGFTVAQDRARAFQENGVDCRLYERIRDD